MKANPYLSFNGCCREAVEFYAECLGGKIEGFFPYAGSPLAETVPPDWQDKVMHATFRIGESILQGADSPPGTYQAPQGICITLQLADPAEAERIYDGLSAGGQITMPLQETFWAKRFATLVDRFGIPWIINCG